MSRRHLQRWHVMVLVGAGKILQIWKNLLNFAVCCVILNGKEVEISFMLKGAILFFAFSLFLFGCTAKITAPPTPPPPLPSQPMPPPEPIIPENSFSEGKVEKPEEQDASPTIPTLPSPPPAEETTVASVSLPDIAITNLFLDKQRRLVATLTNIGSSPFPMMDGNLMVFVDGQFKKSLALGTLSQQSYLPPNESITFTTPLTVFGRHEINAHIDTDVEMKELDKENNYLKRILEGLPIGPDIVLKDLDLTEDLELYIILSNTGEADLRKGVTFRFRIFVNERKISEFEHFISEVLRAHSENHYTIAPPYRVGIGGVSKVRVSVSPKLRSDDICLTNNILERTFIIFPFRIDPQEKEEFIFSVPSLRIKKEDGQGEKIKAEARWEGGGSPLLLSFQRSGDIKGLPTISGESPLKVEFPIHSEEVLEESRWRVSVTNLIEKKVEGHLIIQYP